MNLKCVRNEGLFVSFLLARGAHPCKHQEFALDSCPGFSVGFWGLHSQFTYLSKQSLECWVSSVSWLCMGPPFPRPLLHILQILLLPKMTSRWVSCPGWTTTLSISFPAYFRWRWDHRSSSPGGGGGWQHWSMRTSPTRHSNATPANPRAGV